MTSDEPYRWLEAVANRREYIRDQLRGATPVFAFSRPEGILLFGVGSGKSKVFEIYDRQAFAALGHPVDIEKIRQTVIESAHVEGFTRAPEDVTIRRLLNFSLGPALKTSFETIFSAPLMIECVLAELGETPETDCLARVGFDGSYRFETSGLTVVHTSPADEAAASEWLRGQIKKDSSLGQVARLALAVWRALTSAKTFTAPTEAEGANALVPIDNKSSEWALLDRKTTNRIRYRPLSQADLT